MEREDPSLLSHVTPKVNGVLGTTTNSRSRCLFLLFSEILSDRVGKKGLTLMPLLSFGVGSLLLWRSVGSSSCLLHTRPRSREVALHNFCPSPFSRVHLLQRRENERKKKTRPERRRERERNPQAGVEIPLCLPSGFFLSLAFPQKCNVRLCRRTRWNERREKTRAFTKSGPNQHERALK